MLCLCYLVKGKSLDLSRLQHFPLHVSKVPSYFWSEFHVNWIIFTQGRFTFGVLFLSSGHLLPSSPATPSSPCPYHTAFPSRLLQVLLCGSFPRPVFPDPDFSPPHFTATHQYVWVLGAIPSWPSSLLETWLTWLHPWVIENSYVIPKKDICILTSCVPEMISESLSLSVPLSWYIMILDYVPGSAARLWFFWV